MKTVESLSNKGFEAHANCYILPIGPNYFWVIINYIPAHSCQYDENKFALKFIGPDDSVPIIIGTLNKIIEYVESDEWLEQNIKIKKSLNIN